MQKCTVENRLNLSQIDLKFVLKDDGEPMKALEYLKTTLAFISQQLSTQLTTVKLS